MIDAIEVFVRVVQTGSFAEAARQLSLPTTTVSAKIARLEKVLGTTLIQRTTRRLNITSAGQAYFERCVRALKELQDGKAELQGTAKEPTGILRITATQEVVAALLTPLIETYLAKFPKVTVDLLITGRVVDLTAEGVDLAVRGGELVNSQLIARKFLNIATGMYASRMYLKRYGTPQSPDDLADHQFILFKRFLSRNFRIRDGKKEAAIDYRGRIAVDDMLSVRDFAIANQGIAVLPDFIAKDAVANGSLIRILPTWKFDETGRLSFVFPKQTYMTPKLREFLNLTK